MAPSPSRVATDAELAAEVDHLVEGEIRADRFAGVVLLSHRGQSIVRRAVGYADRERQRANTVDTPFALASVGKMFTAIVVAQLVDQKRIALDATIGSLLPIYPPGPASSQVTVRHLLTMSSGIPDLFQAPQFWARIGEIKTLSDFWPFFANAPLNFPPGTKWAYSNSNFLILGAMVERVVGRPFAATVEQQVFRPVGMTQTSYHVSAFPNAARGYSHTRPDGEPRTPADPKQWYPVGEDLAAGNRTASDGSGDFIVGAPMGGGISTGEDLTRFAEALMAGQLLGPAMTQRAMTGDGPAADYGGHDGYGFETRLLNGVRVVGHRGGFNGIANHVEFYPDLGYVLVILGNTDASGTETIAEGVRNLIAGSPVLSGRRR